MKKTILFIVCILMFGSAICPAWDIWQDKEKTQSLAADQLKADQLVKTLHVTEVLGPLAPIAISPFFGMATLSATSILSGHFGFAKNEFLTGNEALNNPLVFVAFAALALLTSVPKLSSGSKVLAELTDQAESYAGIISYLVVFTLADFGSTATTACSEQVIYTAGIISFSQETLLMLAMIVNIIVINTVKYFFELLALITPVPFLDAVFEVSNKTFAAFLAVIYAFNPYLALLLNIFLFLICLGIFNFARKRIKYLRAILLDPVWQGLTQKDDLDAKTRLRLTNMLSQDDMLIKVFPQRRLGKIKKRDLSYLIIKADEFVLVKMRFLRAAKIEILPKADLTVLVDTGLISNSITMANSAGKAICSLTFSKAYSNEIENIRKKVCYTEHD